jgi:hypothetical protein
MRFCLTGQGEVMNPQSKAVLDAERTEDLPAQERVATGGETGLELSADQVYAQRLAENLPNDNISASIFIP